MLEGAMRRSLLHASGLTSGPPSADAEVLANFVEVALVDEATAGAAAGLGRPEDAADAAAAGSDAAGTLWRLRALAHGLLAAGAAADLDLTLTLGHTLALVDATAPLLRRLLAAASPRGDAALLGEVGAVWSRSPGHVRALTLALVRRGLVPPAKALAWLADPACPVAWATLHTTHAALQLGTDLVAAAADFAAADQDPRVYLGDCAAAALYPLADLATKATKAAEDSGGDSGGDSAAVLHATLCAARAVVRAALGVRATGGAGPLLDAANAASVVARVTAPDLPAPFAEVLGHLVPGLGL
jgi:hypothetical protein